MDNTVVINIKISLKVNNKGYLSIEKKITKGEKKSENKKICFSTSIKNSCCGKLFFLVIIRDYFHLENLFFSFKCEV